MVKPPTRPKIILSVSPAEKDTVRAHLCRCPDIEGKGPSSDAAIGNMIRNHPTHFSEEIEGDGLKSDADIGALVRNDSEHFPFDFIWKNNELTRNARACEIE